MDLVDAQPEFTKAFWDYLDILVNDARMQTGQEMLARHKAIFDRMEKTYGVDRHIVTAIWGVESNFSTQGGDRPVHPLDRDARLRRPPAGLFPRRISGRARDPASWRRAAGAVERLVGRRVRADPIHADVVQALRRGFRRRRPARRCGLRARHDRFDRQQSEEGRLGHRPDLGLRGRRAARLQLSCWPITRAR